MYSRLSRQPASLRISIIMSLFGNIFKGGEKGEKKAEKGGLFSKDNAFKAGADGAAKSAKGAVADAPPSGNKKKRSAENDITPKAKKEKKPKKDKKALKAARKAKEKAGKPRGAEAKHQAGKVAMAAAGARRFSNGGEMNEDGSAPVVKIKRGDKYAVQKLKRAERQKERAAEAERLGIPLEKPKKKPKIEKKVVMKKGKQPKKVK